MKLGIKHVETKHDDYYIILKRGIFGWGMVKDACFSEEVLRGCSKTETFYVWTSKRFYDLSGARVAIETYKANRFKKETIIEEHIV